MTEPADATLIASLEGTATREWLARCFELCEQACERAGASAAEAYAVNLAVEEACTNIVDHAYSGGPPGPIDIGFWKQAGPPERLVVVIRDRAPLFDPSQAPEPDLDASVEERPIGGLGWFLIETMMDSFEHSQRAGGGNCLRLVKTIGVGAQP
jgi:serine/threonine-protein kinase RsbW